MALGGRIVLTVKHRPGRMTRFRATVHLCASPRFRVFVMTQNRNPLVNKSVQFDLCPKEGLMMPVRPAMNMKKLAILLACSPVLLLSIERANAQAPPPPVSISPTDLSFGIPSVN